MDTQIKEDGIMEVKALTMSKGIFRQCREISTKEIQEISHSECPSREVKYIGYVIDTWDSSVGEIQTFWYLTKQFGTLCRIRDVEIFWLITTPGKGVEDREQEILRFRRELPQIFIK